METPRSAREKIEKLTPTEQVAVAITCALEYYGGNAREPYRAWAVDWLSGEDRTALSAIKCIKEYNGYQKYISIQKRIGNRQACVESAINEILFMERRAEDIIHLSLLSAIFNVSDADMEKEVEDWTESLIGRSLYNMETLEELRKKREKN